MRIANIILIAAGMLMVQQSAKAQFSQPAPDGTIYYNQGKVGIGTSTPVDKLEVTTTSGNFGIRIANDGNTTNDFSALRLFQGGTEKGVIYTNQENMFINRSGSGHLLLANSGGNVGIGTNQPQAKLDVAGLAKVENLDVNSGTADGGRIIFRSQGYGEWRARNFMGSLGFFPGEGQPTALWLQSDGNVGIGTICPHAKLAVNGEIQGKKVRVTLDGWCDYVFNKDYKLPALAEVEKYIQQHHHLPEVPSAEEVKNNGLDVGDNQATLLKKIEELTLYAIEQNKKIEDLYKKLDAQNSLLAEMQQKNTSSK